MKAVQLVGLCIISAVLVACNRSSTSSQAQRGDESKNKNIVELATQPPPNANMRPVTLVGCLTASGDKYMLTRMRPAGTDKDQTGGTPAVGTTEGYQLVNADDQLRTLVGQEIRVVGTSAPMQMAQAREITPAQPAGTSGSTAPAAQDSNRQSSSAQVGSQEETRVALHTLRVTSVAPAGSRCDTNAPAHR